MTSESWHRIESLVEATLAFQVSERGRFLDSICGRDASLRLKVEKLVEAFGAAGSFLERPAARRVFLGTTPSDGLTRTRPRPKLEVGSRLGRYRIDGELGRGGMGTVFRTFDTQLRTTVALKTLDRTSPAAIYRFKYEFRSLADVLHPNLVQLYDFESDGDCWYFTMELVDGVDFLRYVRGQHAEGVFPLLHDALGQLVDGLSAIHRSGKLHCDIKPSNIRVTPNGRVVLLDFGLAQDRQTDDMDPLLHAQQMGTPAYMSPEHAAGQPQTTASDWYAVGVVLYQALTGRKLVDAGSMTTWLHRRSRPDAPHFSGPESTVPKRLTELCERLLRPEPMERPSVEDIRHLLGLEEPPPGQRFPTLNASSTFVGRGHHLNALRRCLAKVDEGGTVMVDIHGCSGIGKSTLVREFLRQAGRRNPEAVILSGRCYERESVPYKAFDALMDALGRYLLSLPEDSRTTLLPDDLPALARLFPVLRRLCRTDPRQDGLDRWEQKRRAAGALRELLKRIGQRHCLILYVDDLQWGDIESAELLIELLRPAEPLPMLILSCIRREEQASSPMLRFLHDAKPFGDPLWFEEIALDELDQGDALELAQRQLGHRQANDELASRIAREAGGSPFFIAEMARFLGGEQAVPRRDSGGAEHTLETLIRSRFERLPASARRLLQVVAVAGQPIAVRDALAAAGLESGAPDALTRLRVATFIRGRRSADFDEIEPYHDRIRDLVSSHLDARARAQCHRALAHALEASGRTDPETLATHYRHAGDESREAHFVILAADQASQALAFGRAARLYRSALRLAPIPAEAERLRVQLADALANAGQGAEAAQAYLEAAARAPAAEALDLKRRAADQQLRSGRIEAGLETMGQVLALIGMRMPVGQVESLLTLGLQRLRLWLRGTEFEQREESQVPAERLLSIDVCAAATIGLSNVQPIRAMDFATRYLLLALDAGEPARIARAMALEAGFASIRGVRNHDKTSAKIEASMRLAQQVNEPYPIALTHLSAGLQAFLEGRGSDGCQRFEIAERMFREECTGVTWEVDTLLTYSLRLLVYLGRLRTVAERLPTTLEESVKRGNFYAQANIRGVVGWFMQLVADRPGPAMTEVRRIRECWPRDGYHYQHFLHLMGWVDVMIYRGRRPIAAWRHMEKTWPRLARSQLLRIELARVEALHARCRAALSAAVATDRSTPLGKKAYSQARRHLRRLERERHPWAPPFACLCRAGLETLDGHFDRARAALEEALSVFEVEDLRLYAAVTRRRLGALSDEPKGRKRFAAAEAWMASEGILNTRRMADLLAPGDWPSINRE